MLSDIPVALIVEFCEAHVVSKYIAHFLASHIDLPTYVVLCLQFVLARFIPSFDAILFIGEGNLTCELMSHVSHENVEDVVASVIVANLLTVFEGDLLVSCSFECSGLHADLNIMIRPADQFVIIIWSVNHEMRDGWMVTCLLHEDLRSILSICLVSFTKDGVQRLFKDLFFDKEG